MMNKIIEIPRKSLIIAFIFLINSLSVSQIWGIQDRPVSLLYIAADPGCYSATFVSSRTISMVAPKRLFPVKCEVFHHFEVYWSGTVKTHPGTNIPNGKESINFCAQKGNALKFSTRIQSSYNFGPNESIMIGNWIADKGPEATRFPNRLVCYVALKSTVSSVFKEVKQPIIKGMK